jgi:hypothetical protein
LDAGRSFVAHRSSRHALAAHLLRRCSCLCKPPGDASDVAQLLLIDVGSPVANRARAIVSRPRAAAPAARTDPPANGVRGGPTLMPGATGVVRRSIGGAIHRERLNEPEVALERCRAPLDPRPPAADGDSWMLSRESTSAVHVPARRTQRLHVHAARRNQRNLREFCARFEAVGWRDAWVGVSLLPLNEPTRRADGGLDSAGEAAETTVARRKGHCLDRVRGIPEGVRPRLLTALFTPRTPKFGGG